MSDSIFYYCNNCRKIKGWPQSADSSVGECPVCKTGDLLLNIAYLPINDPEITECPDPCQGDCTLCHLPASLTASDEGNDLDTLGTEIGEMLAKPKADISEADMVRAKETRVDVNGKYTVVMPDVGGLYALRNGKPWRKEDLIGDNLVWCLASELHKAREKIKNLNFEIEAFKDEIGGIV